jgi:hypothetical protein
MLNIVDAAVVLWFGGGGGGVRVAIERSAILLLSPS